MSNLSKLRRSYVERKLSLVETLQKGKDTLELSKQHQLYGAIKEIEHFLKSIEYYEQKAVDERVKFELDREGPAPFSERAGEAWDNFSKQTGKTAKKVGVSVHKVFIKTPSKMFKTAHKKLRLFQETMEEIKKKEHKKEVKKETKTDKKKDNK